MGKRFIVTKSQLKRIIKSNVQLNSAISLCKELYQADKSLRGLLQVMDYIKNFNDTENKGALKLALSKMKDVIQSITNGSLLSKANKIHNIINTFV